MAWGVESILGSFAEAVKWFTDKTPITRPESKAAVKRAKDKSFWVAGVQQVAAVETVQKSLQDALESGQSFQGWKKTIKETLTESTAQHIETVFRTNVQSAYSAGRQVQQAAPSFRQRRPYLMVQTTNDGRRSLICAKLADVIMPADDPRWAHLQPPYHFNCRTTLRSLRAADVERRGGVRPPPAGAIPQDGFGMGVASSPDSGAAGHDETLIGIVGDS